MSLTNIVAIDGEAVEFEWTILGFSTLQNHQGIQSDLRKRNMWNSKTGIIFMWVFNDIDRTTKGNDEICFSNSEKSRNTRKSSRKDTGRFSVLETNRTGVELFFTHVKENETLQPLKWCWESMQKKYWLHKERRLILYSKCQMVQKNCQERPRIPRTHKKAVTNRKEWRSQWRTTRRTRRASTDRIRRWSWSLVRFLVGSRWLHLSSSRGT